MAGAFTQLTQKPDLTGLVDTGYTVADIEGMGDFTRGARQGMRDLYGSLYGLGGLTAGALGINSLRDTALRKANEQQQLSGALAKESDQILNVDGVGSAADYVQHGLGYLVPSLATALVTGGAGGVVGKEIARRGVAGLTEELAKEAIKKGINRGAIAGATTGSFTQEAGSIYPEAIKEGVSHPELRAAVGGLGAAALDVIPEVMAARRIGLLPKASKELAEASKDGVVKSVAKAAGKQSLAEGVTEGGQTVIERVAAGQDPFSHEGIKDIIESTALGALGGGVLGGVTGLHRPQNVPTLVDKPTLANAVSGLLTYKQTPVAYTDSFGGVTIKNVADTDLQDTINQNLNSGPASQGLTNDVVAASHSTDFKPPVVASPLQGPEYTGDTTRINYVDSSGTITPTNVPSLSAAADFHYDAKRAQDLGITAGTAKTIQARANPSPDIDTSAVQAERLTNIDNEINRTRKFHDTIMKTGLNSTAEDVKNHGVDPKYANLPVGELRNRVKLVKDLELKKSLTLMAAAIEERSNKAKADTTQSLLSLGRQRAALVGGPTRTGAASPATARPAPAAQAQGVATPIAGVTAPKQAKIPAKTPAQIEQDNIDTWVEGAALDTKAIDAYVSKAKPEPKARTVYRADYEHGAKKFSGMKVGETVELPIHSTSESMEALHEGVIEPSGDSNAHVTEIRLPAGGTYGRSVSHSDKSHPENVQKEYILKSGTKFKVLEQSVNKTVLEAVLPEKSKKAAVVKPEVKAKAAAKIKVEKPTPKTPTKEAKAKKIADELKAAAAEAGVKVKVKAKTKPAAPAKEVKGSKEARLAFVDRITNGTIDDLKAMVKEHPVMEMKDYMRGGVFDEIAAMDDLIGHGPYNPEEKKLIKAKEKVSKAKAQAAWDEVLDNEGLGPIDDDGELDFDKGSAIRPNLKKVAEFGSEIEKSIRKWTGYGGFKIMGKVGGGELAASYSRIKDLITLSVHGMDKPIAFHESLHRLIEQGLIPDRVLQNVRQILGIYNWDRDGIANLPPFDNKAYDVVVQYMKQTGRGSTVNDQMRWKANDEVIAYAGEMWMEHVGQAPKGIIQRFFAALKAALVEIRNRLFEMDYKTLHEFYRAVDHGYWAGQQPVFTPRSRADMASVKKGEPDGRFSRIREIFANDTKPILGDIPAQDIKNLPATVTKELPKAGTITRRSFVQRVASLLGQGALPSNLLRMAGTKLVKSAINEAVAKALPTKMIPLSGMYETAGRNSYVTRGLIDKYPALMKELEKIGAVSKEEREKDSTWLWTADDSEDWEKVSKAFGEHGLVIREDEGNDPFGILGNPEVARAAEKAGWITLDTKGGKGIFGYEETSKSNDSGELFKFMQKEYAKHGVEYVLGPEEQNFVDHPEYFNDLRNVKNAEDVEKFNQKHGKNKNNLNDQELGSVLSAGVDKTSTMMADSVKRAMKLLAGSGSVTHNETLSYFGSVGDKLRGVASGIPGISSISKLMSNSLGLNTVLHIRDANPHISQVADHVTHLMEFDSIKNAWRTDADVLAQQMMEMPEKELQELAKTLLEETTSGKFNESPNLSKEAVKLYKDIHALFKRFAVELKASTLARIDRQFAGKIEPKEKVAAISVAEKSIGEKYKDPAAAKSKELELAMLRIDNNPTITDKEKAKKKSAIRIENKYAQGIDALKTAEVKAAEERINAQFADQLSTKKKMVADVEEDFTNMMKRPYFPLSRFGEYTLEYIDKEGEKVFQLFEGVPDREKAVAEAKAAGAKDIQTSILDKEIQQSGALMMPVSMIRTMSDSLGLSAEQQSRVQQLLFKLSNPQSFMKHYIHRKNVAGYTTDAVRSFSSYFTIGSSFMARAKMLDTLTGDIDKIRESKTGGDTTILNEIANNLGQKLHNTILPGEEWGAIKQGGFALALAAVPKAALVNLSAIFMIGAPYMAAKFGVVRSGGALQKALSMVGIKDGRIISKDTNPELQAALLKAERYGIIAQSMISEIGSLASAGVESWRYKRIMGVPLGRIFHTAGALFTKAEEINRNVIFSMAWNMEMAKSKDAAQAYATAVHVVQKTMFEYSRWNRPDLLRGGLKGTIFQFKNFLIQYMKLLLAPLGKEDKTEKLASVYMLSSLLLLAGMQGMPGAEDLLDILDTLMSNENVRFNSRRKAKDTLAEMLGDPMADMLMKGVTRGTPFDLSSSFSVGRVVPGVEALLDKSKQKADEVYAALGANLGPVAQWGANTMAAIASDNPDTWKRIESALPNFMKHPSAAVRWTVRGEETDSANRPIKTDFNPFEIGGKALGFTPTSLSKKRELLWEMTSTDKTYQGRRDALIDRVAFTLLNNKGDVKPLVQDIIKYNNDVLAAGMGQYAIDGKSLNSSLTSRATSQQLLVPKKQYGNYQREAAHL